jgi:hypothetical protein
MQRWLSCLGLVLALGATATATNIYKGGDGDGYAGATATFSDPFNLSARYKGGSGDGHASANVSVSAHLPFGTIIRLSEVRPPAPPLAAVPARRWTWSRLFSQLRATFHVASHSVVQWFRV